MATKSKLTVRDAHRGRGLSRSTTLGFRVILDCPHTKDVKVHATTAEFPMDGPNIAKPDIDFVSKEADLVIPAGETEVLFSVRIIGTADLVPDKLFLVKLSHASVTVADGSAFGIVKYGKYPQTN